MIVGTQLSRPPPPFFDLVLIGVHPSPKEAPTVVCAGLSHQIDRILWFFFSSVTATSAFPDTTDLDSLPLFFLVGRSSNMFSYRLQDRALPFFDAPVTSPLLTFLVPCFPVSKSVNPVIASPNRPFAFF